MDLLDNEVPILREADLVREFEQMSAGWHQRERRQHEGNELHCFKRHGTRSGLSDSSAQARRHCALTLRTSRLAFPRADPV
jgi:hypothetical protein